MLFAVLGYKGAWSRRYRPAVSPYNSRRTCARNDAYRDAAGFIRPMA
jgi:hypothetical protein